MSRLIDWYEEAHRVEPDSFASEAMILATSTPQGCPSVRVVSCRGLSENGIRFFTNRQSQKGVELESDPFVAILFFWPALRRQVRITGVVNTISNLESDTYFATRARAGQISACASPQSQVIESFEWLDSRARDIALRYAHCEIPRPPVWGGYLCVADSIEFWQRGPERLHRREFFRKSRNGWSVELLAP